METPIRAGAQPAKVTLEKGKNYAWCACGESKKQPFCDGSHKTTGFRPHVFRAGEDGTFYLCMCKQTGNKPFCDGTHKK